MAKQVDTTNHPSLTPSKIMVQLKRLTFDLVKAGRQPTPVMLHGKAGIGKSALIAAFAREHNFNLIDFRLLLKDPTDIGGMPFFNTNEGRVEISDPAQLPPNKRDIPHLKKKAKRLEIDVHNLNYSLTQAREAAAKLEIGEETPESKAQTKLLNEALNEAIDTVEKAGAKATVRDQVALDIAKQKVVAHTPVIVDAEFKAQTDIKLNELATQLEYLEKEHSELLIKLSLVHSVILMDELSSAPPAVQAAALQLVLDRKINDYELPDEVIMIAAGNRKGDGNVYNEMPVPLRNRFAHFDMEESFKDWTEWATADGGIHPVMIALLKEQPNLFYTFKPERKAHMAFSTPRSIERASNSVWLESDEMGNINNMSQKDRTELVNTVAASVGMDVARALDAFMTLYGKIPRTTDIASGKVTTWDYSNMKTREQQSAIFAFVLSSHQYLNVSMKNLEDKVASGQMSKEDYKKAITKFVDNDVSNIVKFILTNLENSQEFAGMALANYARDKRISGMQKLPEFKDAMKMMKGMLSVIR